MLNSFPFHAVPLALNVANNFVLKTLDPSGNNKIQVANHPWTNSSKTAASMRSLKQNYHPDPQMNGHPYQNQKNYDSCQLIEFKKVAGGCVLLLLVFILFTCPFILGP